ncbi:MAG: C-GCAxxG-C-C family (seleno)protein [Oscillospiraceae bacterium]|nr:C-GCAxxG-C-C family (seleno)protein [Oscillospiraceae bacterium]
MLKDVAAKYNKQDYNCAETIIRAANEYYNLGLHERDMIMQAGFGGGIQTASTCGALLSAVSVLSLKYVETRAHESKDIQPVVFLLTKKFKERYGSTLCKDVKPQSFDKVVRCLNTVTTACDILEETLAEYQPKASQES